MDHPIDEKLLMAYADGELPAERRRAVEQYLAEHPEARQLVENYRLLNRAAQRTVRQDTPLVPRQLRETIEQLVASEPLAPVEPLEPLEPEPASPSPAPAPALTPREQRTRTWWPLAAAAALLLVVGAVAWLVLRQDQSEPSPMVKGTPAPEAASQEHSNQRQGPLSGSLVADVRRVHEKCSGLLDHFISDEFGKSLEQVPAQAEKFFSGSASPVVPDLSSLGYAFDGAGPCTIPGGKTLHLLYRHRNGEDDHISVFIQTDRGQLAVEPDKLHQGVGDDPQHPILALRRRGLVYYITADAAEPAAETAKLLTSSL